jgi:hypothetical protein
MKGVNNSTRGKLYPSGSTLVVKTIQTKMDWALFWTIKKTFGLETCQFCEFTFVYRQSNFIQYQNGTLPMLATVPKALPTTGWLKKPINMPMIIVSI